MDGENRPEELEELRSRAFQALEHPEQLEPREAVEQLRPLLRLWRYPSLTFADHRSWTIFTTPRNHPGERMVLVREVTWDSPHDLSRFANPLEWLKQGHRAPPSLRVRDVKLAYSLLSPLLDDLAQLPVPVAGVKPLWGLDGERFGFEYSDSSFLRARLEWWCDGPAEWKAFTDSVARLRVLLRRLLHEDGMKDTDI